MHIHGGIHYTKQSANNVHADQTKLVCMAHAAAAKQLSTGACVFYGFCNITVCGNQPAVTISVMKVALASAICLFTLVSGVK